MDVAIRVTVYDENAKVPYKLLFPSHRKVKLGMEAPFLNGGTLVMARKTYWPEHHASIKKHEDYENLRSYLGFHGLQKEVVDLIMTVICGLGFIKVLGAHEFSSYFYLNEDEDAVQYQVLVRLS